MLATRTLVARGEGCPSPDTPHGEVPATPSATSARRLAEVALGVAERRKKATSKQRLRLLLRHEEPPVEPRRAANIGGDERFLVTAKLLHAARLRAAGLALGPRERCRWRLEGTMARLLGTGSLQDALSSASDASPAPRADTKLCRALQEELRPISRHLLVTSWREKEAAGVVETDLELPNGFVPANSAAHMIGENRGKGSEWPDGARRTTPHDLPDGSDEEGGRDDDGKLALTVRVARRALLSARGEHVFDGEELRVLDREQDLDGPTKADGLRRWSSTVAEMRQYARVCSEQRKPAGWVDIDVQDLLATALEEEWRMRRTSFVTGVVAGARAEAAGVVGG